MNSNPANQYVHTTGEIIQRIALLNGGKMPPKGLIKYIFEDEILKNEQKYALQESDVVVIEVSSIKQIQFGVYFLQLNRLINETRGSMGKGKKFEDWMKKLRRLVKDGQKKEIRNRRISKNPEKVIHQLNTKLQDELDLERDLKKIVDSLDSKILLVSHINIPKISGEMLRSRESLCEMLKSISHRLDVRLFDPTSLVKGKKRKVMLKKDGEDINHYSEFGEDEVGNMIHGEITELINNE